MQTFFTHRPVSTLDRVFFQLTDELTIRVRYDPHSGDLDAVDDALGRAWCGGEISLAGLDRHALNALMNACVAKTREQTRGEKWNHGDCDLVGVKTLARLVGRRYAAAKRFGRGGEGGTGASDARAAIEWHARVHKLEGIATDVTAGDDEDACAAKLETFVDVLGAFYRLVPIRPRRRGERRSFRTLPGASLRPLHAFNTRPRRLSTPPRCRFVWNDTQPGSSCPSETRRRTWRRCDRSRRSRGAS